MAENESACGGVGVSYIEVDREQVSAEEMLQAWLPDGYGQLFILYVFGPSVLKGYGSAKIQCKI